MKARLVARLFAAGLLSSAFAASGQAAAAASDARDPAAMAALEHMGESLRSHADVNVHADVTMEDVLIDGQKIQYGGTVDILAHRPKQLKMVLKIGDAERQLFYDGSTMTLYSPNLKYYAQAAAPATIGEALAAAQNNYGLEIPLADLFTWGQDPSLAERITSALVVGTETIGGQTCNHYAMRQEAVDWQIWIRQGDDALPCKLVITSKTDSSMPQVTSVYNWGEPTSGDSDAFTFKAPDGTQQIALRELKAPKTEK